MTETEFRKAVLLARIDAHRSIFRLELRAARQSLDPLAVVLGWFGVDRALVESLVPAIRTLYREGLPGDVKHAGPLVALVAALLVAWAS